MSFLETTDDDKVTVTEALAFIDSFEASLSKTVLCGLTIQSPGSGNSSTASGPQSSPSARKNSRKPKRKKKPNPPGYTTRVQQRKRAELQSLRDEAQALEERVDQLQRLNPGLQAGNVGASVEVAAIDVSKWEELVELERKARRQSEETNRKL